MIRDVFYLGKKPNVHPREQFAESLADARQKATTEHFWIINEFCDYSNFEWEWDFDLLADDELWHSEHNNVWPSKYDKDSGTWLCPQQPSETFLYRVDVDPLAYLDEKLPVNKYVIQTTLDDLIQQHPNEIFWAIQEDLDYSSFDFTQSPNISSGVAVFGSQINVQSQTYYVNSRAYKVNKEFVYLENDIILIDHGNLSEEQLALATKQYGMVVQYESSYLKTLKNIIKLLPEKENYYAWVISSICDYRNFNFGLNNEFKRLREGNEIFVYPSGTQKYGDTFYINVSAVRKRIDDVPSLAEYTGLRFCQFPVIRRLPMPKIMSADSHVSEAYTDFSFPYAVMVSNDNAHIEDEDFNVPLWEGNKNAIYITSTGASRILYPKNAHKHTLNELYDFPYIITNSNLIKSKPLDIIFLSNNEKNADENYKRLLFSTRNAPNRVVRVNGINGRVNAYHAAATASETSWFFAVFAKLSMRKKFDWDWQPDRLQIPKHYVFHAKNPINNLIYGHQALIAYNKNLVLNNFGNGLDFTMDDKHTIIKILSGEVNYDSDPLIVWKTAFREVIKLRVENSTESNKRLKTWLNVGNGKYGEYSIKGARDGIDYYNEVNGDMKKLKLSYEWAWLEERFNLLSS